MFLNTLYIRDSEVTNTWVHATASGQLHELLEQVKVWVSNLMFVIRHKAAQQQLLSVLMQDGTKWARKYPSIYIFSVLTMAGCF